MYLEDGEDGEAFVNKPMKEFKEVTVERIKDKMYLIAGEREVFILNDGTSYSRKLSTEELEELGIHIMWTSKVNLIYIFKFQIAVFGYLAPQCPKFSIFLLG